VIVTVPLGVLQAGGVVFEPRPASLSALDHLAMGPVQRLVLVFREPFWAPKMSFLFARDQLPGVWWTTSPRASTVLTGWIGGPRALLVPDAEDLLAQALASLETMYTRAPGNLRAALLSWHLHDWQADPYSRGAYSYALVGGVAAVRQLSEPVAETLFFAGEHTDTTGHPGTVHGALRSGLRAAAQVLAARDRPHPFAQSASAKLL
jgi:monoamine oxidase